MNKRFFLCTAFIIGAVLSVFSCAKREVRSPEILCLEHGTHCYHGDNKEMYDCAGLDYSLSRSFFRSSGNYDDYASSISSGQTIYLIQSAAFEYTGDCDVAAETSRLKQELDSYLSYSIKLSMIRAFGEAGEQAWSMQKITIPVIYRSFKTNFGTSGKLVLVAFYDRKDLSPLALLKYLPLEYKMEFMKRRKRDSE